jgi:glycosyltransferase involved in cell wall biosynthesis
MNVSCILTIHNKESMITKVCQSLVDTLSDNTKELIIVFDGCTDSSEALVKSMLSGYTKKIKYVYTDDVFETRANNAGLAVAEGDYVLLIQDDMIINEVHFDARMLEPFNTFNDVFAVTAQTAHNNRIIGGILQTTDSADRRTGYPRNQFAVREIANRGPLMYNHIDLRSLGYFDEYLAPNSYDDHDISYKAYTQLGKVSGLYWIDYDSKSEWGTGRQKNQHIHAAAHARNSQIIINRYGHLLNGSIKNENRVV